MSKQSLAVKYRPKKFEDVVEQTVPKTILCEQLKNKSFKNCLLFCGGAGTGKAQPLYSKVLTPNGFITMGEVTLNTIVITGNGNEATVTNIYYPGERPVYEITLSNCIKFRVADEHLNTIYEKQGDSYIEYTEDTNKLLKRDLENTYIRIISEDLQTNEYYSIKSIIPIDADICKCIYVDAPEHTYITDNYVVTHNTTSARIFANEINDFKGHPIEIDAASHNGVDDARKIIDDARTQSLDSEYKTFILDECFHKDTLISTIHGLKKISEITLGEEVYNLTNTGIVEGIAENNVVPKRLVIVTTTTGDILTTSDHLFFTSNGWVEANKLTPNTFLLDMDIFNSIYAKYYKIDSQTSDINIFTAVTWENLVASHLQYSLKNVCKVVSILSYSEGNTAFEKYFTKEELYSPYVKMYDLQVSGHPSYYANGVLVHNCHMLSNAAWNAMLKVIEEPPKKTVFLFCTTDPQKIPSTILSRVQRYNFQKISLDGIINRLKYIVKEENKNICEELGNEITPDMDVLIDYEDSAIEFIAKLADGGMRDSITLLDKALGYSNHLTLVNVMEALGSVNYDTMFSLTDALNKMESKIVLETINDVYKTGLDLKQFIKQYSYFVLDLCKYKYLRSFDNLQMPVIYKEKLDSYNDTDFDFFCQLLDTILELSRALKDETVPKPLVESKLLLLCMEA